MSDVKLDKMLRVVDRWKQQYGEAVAKELIMGYLSGLNDACRTLSELGNENMQRLYDHLEGN